MSPVERLALFARLVQECSERSSTGSLNKTQLQKLTYLAQSLGVTAGFEFRMHHYGPYSFDLEDAAGMLENFGVLKASIEDHGTYVEYRFSPEPTLVDFVTQVGHIDAAQEQLIARTAELFAHRGTRDLELLGTVHLVHSLLSREGRGAAASRDVVVRTVTGLKPRFPTTEIEREYDELAKKGMLPKQR